MAHECQQCRDNRNRKVGEKLENVTRKDGGVFCNDCRKLIATYPVQEA